ncbi:hypothetical protein DIPPA_27645 [Diplonema papillatum]|nr:hypothetical protein DIPPA_27645 [Diplonema papillatum]KAJ9463709.1 hypothetical protein DIPPA_27645 [Diplonema papillatum]
MASAQVVEYDGFPYGYGDNRLYGGGYRGPYADGGYGYEGARHENGGHGYPAYSSCVQEYRSYPGPAHARPAYHAGGGFAGGGFAPDSYDRPGPPFYRQTPPYYDHPPLSPERAAPAFAPQPKQRAQQQQQQQQQQAHPQTPGHGGGSTQRAARGGRATGLKSPPKAILQHPKSINVLKNAARQQQQQQAGLAGGSVNGSGSSAASVASTACGKDDLPAAATPPPAKPEPSSAASDASSTPPSQQQLPQQQQQQHPAAGLPSPPAAIARASAFNDTALPSLKSLAGEVGVDDPRIKTAAWRAYVVRVTLRRQESVLHWYRTSLKPNETVLVSADRGFDIGKVVSCSTAETAAEHPNDRGLLIPVVFRPATEDERLAWIRHMPEQEKQAVAKAREILAEVAKTTPGLKDVAFTDAGFQYDGRKVTLYYETHNEGYKFSYRPMLKPLFDTFGCRIWLQRALPAPLKDGEAKAAVPTKTTVKVQ